MLKRLMKQLGYLMPRYPEYNSISFKVSCNYQPNVQLDAVNCIKELRLSKPVSKDTFPLVCLSLSTISKFCFS